MTTEKVALVTGAAKRIGATTVRTLHQRGYRTIIHCRSAVEEAQALAAELNQQRADSAHVCIQDLAEKDGATLLARSALACFGRIDLLVNNASSFFPTPVGTIDFDHWQQLVGSNMKAPLFLSQALAPTLKQHQGSIVNLIDVHGHSPLKDHTLYSMAKAALLMMTKSLALELAPEVTVNGVSPGAILWPNEQPSEERQKKVLAQVPLQRLGSAADIAQTIAFLGCDAPYITGQIIAVDGGRSLGALEGA